MQAPGSHPHFNDRGALFWHTRWAKAQTAAQAEGRLILIELGRRQCSSCRTLVEAIVPRPDVAPLLADRFVALAADADDAEEEVEDLCMKLEDASMLPFVVIADANGQYLAGTWGAQTPASFLTFLRAALERAG